MPCTVNCASVTNPPGIDPGPEQLHAKRRRKDRGDHEVRERPRRRDRRTLTRIAQVERVERHRLPPAEARDAHRRATERVDVAARIEGPSDDRDAAWGRRIGARSPHG